MALLASPSAAATLIAPAALVAHQQDLPGFAGAKSWLDSTTSASVFARDLDDSWSEAESEAAYLRHEGFREGVEEGFHSARREGVSVAFVFGSPRAAEHELVSSTAQDVKEFDKLTLQRFTVRGVPGSVGLGSFLQRKHAVVADVLFSTGRCFLVIGSFVRNARSSAQGTSAPIAGAQTLYKRTRGLCA
jgi:hypothetical protein